VGSTFDHFRGVSVVEFLEQERVRHGVPDHARTPFAILAAVVRACRTVKKEY
jgi:hypothetical protein